MCHRCPVSVNKRALGADNPVRGICAISNQKVEIAIRPVDWWKCKFPKEVKIGSNWPGREKPREGRTLNEAERENQSSNLLSSSVWD